MRRLGLALAGLLALLPLPSLAQAPQCVTNVAAQGTSDAITSAQLPCGTSSNLVILTAAFANLTTTPTYQPIGSPALRIVLPSGAPVAVGDLQPNYVALLSSTGTSWVLLNPVLGSASGAAAIVANNNAALASFSTTTAASITRVGYTTAGDSAPVVYVGASSCPYDGGVAKGGSCVGSADGKFWVLQSQPTMDLRDWGSFPGQGSSTDEAPGIRQACAYAATNGSTIEVPGGQYWMLTLDGSGLGALVMQGSGGNTVPGCDMEGTVKTLYPYNGTNDTGCGVSTPGGPVEPEFILGPGLNRPVLYIGILTYTPYWKGICLDGNKTAQTGWSGGPHGSLFVVDIADWTTGVTTESSWRFDYVGIQNGYNGCLYEGAGRGSMWSEHSWCSYSGQTTSDAAMFFAGCDTTLINPAVGSSAGTGIYYGECAQHQVTDGAVFYNGNNGIQVDGDYVNYLNVKGTNIQHNDCDGIRIGQGGPFQNEGPAGMTFVAVTFDGNSQTATNTCDDFHQDAYSPSVSLVAPTFNGDTTPPNPQARYNIYGYHIEVTAPVLPSNYQLATFTANSAVISFTNLFVAGQRVYFTANAMPAGLTQGTVYYVSATGLSGSQFEVCADAACSGGPIAPTTIGTTVTPHLATFDTAFTNNWPGLNCAACAFQIPWTPFPTTDSTVGTPTYTSSGWWQRSNNEIFAHFELAITAWSGSPAGHFEIGGLPLNASVQSNLVGVCTLDHYNGWTHSGASYTNLIGFVSPYGTVIGFNQNSADGTGSTAALVGQFSTTTTDLNGVCVYEVNPF